MCERKFLFLPCFLDPDEGALIDAGLPADGVFVDVGAGVGLHTLWAARRLGERGRVLALEPDPAAFARLVHNLAVNGLQGRVTALRCGAADREGAFDLRPDPARPGASIRVPCRPLEALLAEHGLERVDILRIDVEGAEDRVLPPFLKAAPASRHPHTVLLEAGPGRRGGDRIGEVEALGYRVACRTRASFVLRKAARAAALPSTRAR